ncbi:Resolvase protein [Enterococcus casseliflavus]|nr:Resolvase protein [Enterococcus casseliflavus]
MTIYGYARVSTRGQNLREQIKQLKDAGVDKENIFHEKYTGAKSDRPEFQKMLSLLKKNDTIIVTKLDRFARNTREALGIIEPLLDSDVTIKVLNLGAIENTPMGKMIVRTLLSVAEMERDMILERTQEGKIYAKKHNPNYREGRPKATLNKQKLHAFDLLQSGKSYREVSLMTGFSKSTLQRIKKIALTEKGSENDF